MDRTGGRGTGFELKSQNIFLRLSRVNHVGSITKTFPDSFLGFFGKKAFDLVRMFLQSRAQVNDRTSPLDLRRTHSVSPHKLLLSDFPFCLTPNLQFQTPYENSKNSYLGKSPPRRR